MLNEYIIFNNLNDNVMPYSVLILLNNWYNDIILWVVGQLDRIQIIVIFYGREK